MARIPMTRREFLARVRDAAIVAAAVELAEAPPAAAAAQSATGQSLDGRDAAVLATVGRRLFPLRNLGDAPYAAVVAALDGAAARDASTRDVLTGGCAAFRRHFGDGWQTATDAAHEGYLRSVEQTPFFRTVMAIAVPTFVAHPAVWAAVGYEGESASKGGYLHRGFNSLDWLPEPPADSMGGMP